MANMQDMLNEVAGAMGVAPLPVKTRNKGNAATDGSTIYFNPRFLGKVSASSGEGGVRFVLAHELGHARQGMTGGHAGELAADQFAARSVATLGFGWDAISGVMDQLPSTSSRSHPGSGERSGTARTVWSGVAQTNLAEERKAEKRKKMKRMNIRQGHKKDRNRPQKSLGL